MATVEAAEADSRVLATLLEDQTPLTRRGQSESPANLLRASDHVVLQSLKVMQAGLALLFTKTNTEPPDNLNGTLARCQAVIESIGLISYKQERRDAGNFDMGQELICELYDWSGDEFIETKFKLSDAKNLPSFAGTEDNIPIAFESFVHAIANHGKASKLNSKGLASLLLHKITGSAARILTSSLVLRDLKEEDLDAPMLVTICESLFMASCSVKQSKLQLTQLKPLSEHSIAFTELQANLVRLVQLSVRDIPEKTERDIIFKCRTQDYFNNLIPPRPRALLTEHNAQRVRAGLEHLSLAASVVFLNEKFSSEKTDQLISQELRKSSSINKVEHFPMVEYDADEPEGQPEDNEYVLVTRAGGRGAFRGRGRGRDDFGRQGYPKFSGNQGAPIIPQNLRGAPPPPDWRNGGRGRGAAPATARGRRPYKSMDTAPGRPGIHKEAYRDMAVTCSTLGVAPRSCWSCGDPSHRVGNEACFYKETPLQTQSCSACHMGGHLKQHCCGPNQRAIQALRDDARAKAITARGGAPPPPRGGRGAAPRGAGRGDGRGRGNLRRQVHQVSDNPQFEDITEDPFEEYLAELENNQDF